jgi:hypothetical protein
MSAPSAKPSAFTADQAVARPASPFYAKLCHGAAKNVGAGRFCSKCRRLPGEVDLGHLPRNIVFQVYITADRLLTMSCKLICGFIIIKWSGEVDLKFGAIAAEQAAYFIVDMFIPVSYAGAFLSVRPQTI